MDSLNDVALREAYAKLTARPSGRVSGEVTPEVLASLAQGLIGEPEHSRLLDLVINDSLLRQEYEFLHGLTQVAPRQPAKFRPFMLAALLFGAIGGALVWRIIWPAPLDTVRGAAADIELVSPEATATLSAGSRLVWHAVPGATAYRVELTLPDGSVVFEQETADTVMVLPPTAPSASIRSVSWVVGAHMAGGNYLRSPSRRLSLRP